MAKTLQGKLSSADIGKLIKALEDYGSDIQKKGEEICRRLASTAELRVSVAFASTAYKGPKHVDVTVEAIPNGFAVVASGKTVLILEFGAGKTYGYGHPQAGDFGMGPGTYPGQKHAFNDNGWWLPKSAGGGHTYGNAPSMAMYFAAKEARMEVEKVAREVFGS